MTAPLTLPPASSAASPLGSTSPSEAGPDRPRSWPAIAIPAVGRPMSTWVQGTQQTSDGASRTWSVPRYAGVIGAATMIDPATAVNRLRTIRIVHSKGDPRTAASAYVAERERRTNWKPRPSYTDSPVGGGL